MIRRIIPILLAFVFLAASIVYVSDTKQPVKPKDEGDISTSESVEPAEELRGVWVTYMTLDVESESDKESAFKSKVDSIIEDMKAFDLNTMIVQVRPFSDALYRSRYYPWSHILTGSQGEDPGYDPLEYIIEKAHNSDIKVHAWINPYRITTANTPTELSDDNPYVKDNDIGVEINGALYLDPSSDKARRLIVNGAAEIAEKYDVDGIQFDDYFYPPDCGDFDSKAYEAYRTDTNSPLSLDDFRKDNVNKLIKDVYEAVHKAKRDTVFGISPQGHLSNNDGLYADVRTWCKEDGYIDYICPQLYFSLDNPALTFEEGLRDWMETEKHKGLDMYIGLPAYKAGTDADEGTWLDNDDILATEIAILREKGCQGFILYSYDSFHNEDNSAEIQNVMNYLTTSPTQ